MNKIKVTENEKIKFRYQTKIRIGDLNYGNHLAHDKLISIVHDARISFFLENNLSEVNYEDKFLFMIKSLSIDYINQSFLHENLKINIYVGEINKVSFELKYEILKDNSLVALCVTTLVCYNTLKRRLDQLPASFISVLLK